MAVDGSMPVPTQGEIAERKIRKQQQAQAEWERRGCTRCSTCKAPVVYAKNATSGKWQIIDAPVDWVKGNITLSGQATHQLTATVHNADDAASNRAAGVPYHTDHHATCPHVEQHRRSK